MVREGAMSPTETPRRFAVLLAWLVAFIGPVLVIAPLMRPPEPPPPGPPSAAAAAMDAQILAADWDVVVLGDSSAEQGIHGDLLGQALADPPLRVLRLAGAGGEMAPVWYAVLRDRVYGNGKRPRLVVLGAYLSGVVATRLDDVEYSLLQRHVAVPDEVLLRKTWRTAPPSAGQRLVDRATAGREAVVSAFRYGPASLWLDGAAARVTEASKVVFGGVHAPNEGGAAGTLLVTPGTDAAQGPANGPATGPEGGTGHAAAPSPEETYLPAIAALVARNGGRLVVVLPPTLSGEYPALRVPSALSRGMAELASRLGVGWLDERDLPLERADFSDPRHLNGRGARTFTRFLAARLQQIGALGTGPLAPAIVPPRYTVRREGTPPEVVAEGIATGSDPCTFLLPLPALSFLADDALRGEIATGRSPLLVEEGGVPLAWMDDPGRTGCIGMFRFEGGVIHGLRRAEDGPPLTLRLDDAVPVRSVDPHGPLGLDGWADLYWVYPGTTLRWTFDAPWRPPGARYDVDVELSGVAGQRTEDASTTLTTPVVTLLGQPVPLVPTETGWRVHVEVPVTDTPWALEVASPAGGPYLLVHTLTFTQGGERVRIIEAPFLPVVDLFAAGTSRVEGPVPPPSGGRIYDGSPSAFWMHAPFPNHAGCSPLRVTEDGRPLPRYPGPASYVPVVDPLAPSSRADPVTFLPGGGAVHAGERVYFSASDDSDPVGNGRRYQITVQEDRKCWLRQCEFCVDRSWIYPGDRLTLTLPAAGRSRLNYGLYAVALSAVWNTDPSPETTIHARIDAGGTTRFEGDIPIHTLLGERVLPVRPPVLRDDPGDIEITLDAPADAPPLLLTGYATQD